MLFEKCEMLFVKFKIEASCENECPSPDGNGISRFRKQGFLAVVFLYREYSGQQVSAP